MTAGAVFRSVNQALHVSFLMAVLPPTQKSNTQMLIEQLMRDAGVSREVQADGTLNFHGLSPLDVRAQCAMVRASVEHHCTEPERMAIWAWFAHDGTKADGVRYLCKYFAHAWSVDSPHARMLMAWRASVTDDSKAARHCSYRDIEGEHGIPKSSAQRQVQAFAKLAKRLRDHGAWRLEELFLAHGLIDHVDTVGQ